MFLLTFLFCHSGQIISILRTWKDCQPFQCCLPCLEMGLCFRVLSWFVISCGNYLSFVDSYTLLITNYGNAIFAYLKAVLWSNPSLRQILLITQRLLSFITWKKISREILFLHFTLHLEALSSIFKTIVNYSAK